MKRIDRDETLSRRVRRWPEIDRSKNEIDTKKLTFGDLQVFGRGAGRRFGVVAGAGRRLALVRLDAGVEERVAGGVGGGGGVVFGVVVGVGLVVDVVGGGRVEVVARRRQRRQLVAHFKRLAHRAHDLHRLALQILSKKNKKKGKKGKHFSFEAVPRRRQRRLVVVAINYVPETGRVPSLGLVSGT